LRSFSGSHLPERRRCAAFMWSRPHFSPLPASFTTPWPAAPALVRRDAPRHQPDFCPSCLHRGLAKREIAGRPASPPLWVEHDASAVGTRRSRSLAARTHILWNCKSVVNMLASIRNKMGDAHGKAGETAPPACRAGGQSRRSDGEVLGGVLDCSKEPAGMTRMHRISLSEVQDGGTNAIERDAKNPCNSAALGA
jgi:hypothetical protein